jgi:hypothetical protein
MAGITSFTVDVAIQNAGVIPELASRAADLTPAFTSIILGWAENNINKFEKGIGQEAAGVDQGSGVDWTRLTPTYMKTKRRLGQDNQLMVATGALENALTNPDLFFQMVNPEQAIFGTPNDPDDADKVKYNWPTEQNKKRQVLFLSLDDQRMIQKTVFDYLRLGGDFEKILFAQGLQSQANRNLAAKMDIEFNATVNS